MPENRLTKQTVEKGFGGIWLDNSVELRNFTSAARSQGYLKNENYVYAGGNFYLYYVNNEYDFIPYVAIEASRENKEVIETLKNIIENDGQREGIKYHLDKYLKGNWNRENKSLGDNVGNSNKSAPSSNVGLDGRNIRTGGYFNTPWRYAKAEPVEGDNRVNPQDSESGIRFRKVTPEMDAEYMTAEEKNIWQKVADWVRSLFAEKFNADEAKAEVLAKEVLTEEDIAKMIRASYETLQNNKVDNEVASVDGDKAIFCKKGGKNNESPANSKTSESGQPASAKRNASLTNVSAKVGKNVKRANRLDAIISSIEKIGEMGPHEFLHEVVNAMLLSEDVSTEVSRYAKLGGGVTLRLADHYGKASNYKGRKNEIYNYGLVVKLSNKAFVPDKNVDYLEYVYFPDKLTKERQIEIAKGLKAFMETGRYELLPKPDKVNPSGKFQQGNGTKFRKVTPEMDAEYISAVENAGLSDALIQAAIKERFPELVEASENNRLFHETEAANNAIKYKNKKLIADKL